MDLDDFSLAEASKLLSSGTLTAVELTTRCLKRISHVDQELNAFITIDEQGALEQAAAADEKRKNGKAGKLCGIPLSIKDLIATRNLRTTCGSKILEHYVPPYDATVIRRLREEGAVIVGKTTMDEFAMGSTSETCAFGVPRNPLKKGYVAGGSSGGSAVSVAAFESFASLGSDTGGSIRQPAALCGIVGLKPTYGRVSRYGLTAFASSLDQIGPLTRTVEDCAIVMQTISGYDPLDSTSVNRAVPDYCRSLAEGLDGITIGIPKEYFTSSLNSEVEKEVRKGIELLRSRGAKIVDVSLPHTEYCVAVYYIVAPSEASSNLARYDGIHYGFRDSKAQNLIETYRSSRSNGFGAEVKRRIILGTYSLSSGYYDAYYRKASQVRTLIVGDYNRAFETCDILASPVVPTAAWPLGQNSEDPLAVYLSDILTLSANLAGVPGLSVPVGFTQEGLPVGLQLQGPHFSEELLLKVGFNVEKGLSLPKRALYV